MVKNKINDMSRGTHVGFALIEMRVVIAINEFWAMLLLPALDRAKPGSCLSCGGIHQNFESLP